MKHSMLFLTFCFALSMMTPKDAAALDDIVLYYPNGAAISIPSESWSVGAWPKGYNLLPYDPNTNPKGKGPGWTGWPEYDGACERKLVVGGSQSRACERQPYWISWPEPEPEPQTDCVDPNVRELTVGGAPKPKCEE